MGNFNNLNSNTNVSKDFSTIDVVHLPFNQLIGLESAAESGFLVSIPDSPKYTNHLGTVHASAMLAVAEAGSGTFLSRQLADYSRAIPVVRRIEAKFCKPGIGEIFARCKATPEDVAQWVNELTGRGRVLASLPMEVVDASGTIVMSATVEWFVTHAPLTSKD